MSELPGASARSGCAVLEGTPRRGCILGLPLHLGLVDGSEALRRNGSRSMAPSPYTVIFLLFSPSGLHLEARRIDLLAAFTFGPIVLEARLHIQRPLARQLPIDYSLSTRPDLVELLKLHPMSHRSSRAMEESSSGIPTRCHVQSSSPAGNEALQMTAHEKKSPMSCRSRTARCVFTSPGSWMSWESPPTRYSSSMRLKTE